MLTMLGSPKRCCDGVTRREALRAGGLALLGAGMQLPQLYAAEERRPAGQRPGRAKSVIMLYLLGGAKRWRRGTLRFQEESARIEAWLAKIESLAADNYLVAVQLAKAQRLVKGYGETHERGWRNFTALLGQVDSLAARSDGGSVLARLIDAALADEEGTRLRSEIAALAAPGVGHAA